MYFFLFSCWSCLALVLANVHLEMLAQISNESDFSHIHVHVSLPFHVFLNTQLHIYIHTLPQLVMCINEGCKEQSSDLLMSPTSQKACVCTHGYMYVCIYVCIYISHKFICMCMHMHAPQWCLRPIITIILSSHSLMLL